MAEIRKERTARKRHKCDRHRCEGWIEPGERYIDSKLTPYDPDVANHGWLHAKLHLSLADCTP